MNDTTTRMTGKPGERRLQILQTLATMLEAPRGEKVTTAALAAKLDVSERSIVTSRARRRCSRD